MFGRLALGAPETERRQIGQALRAWNIDDFVLDRNLGGTSRASWRVVADGKPYVLRGTTGQHAYLDYQIRVLRHLAASSFPYAIPRLIPTAADGSPFAEGESEIRWVLYPYIAGARPGRFAVRRVRRDIARLVASFDVTVADIHLGDAKGYYALTLFDREKVSRKLAAWDGLPHFRSLSRRIVSSILERYLAIPGAS